MMRTKVTSKLPDVGTTIFTVMSQLADETGAINLSQGFPSFSPPAALVDRITHHLHHGDNQYPPMAGVPALRQAIAGKTSKLYGPMPDPELEITVCSGATEGLFAAIQAVVRRGDEVIVFDPAYDSYEPAVTLAGGITRHIALCIEGDNFGIDWDQLQDTISSRTRLIILNFPHNPSGAIIDADDLERLADLVRDTDVLLLSDEVYEHIIFDGRKHISLLQHDELRERCFVVSSFGKTFHATGWKVGYCIAPPELSTEFRKVHQFVTFTVNTPVQNGIADFLSSHPDFYLQLSDFYEQKRDLFCEQLRDSRFALTPSKSTFFQLLDYSAVTSRNDVELAQDWTREIGVASIPLSVFCAAPPARKFLRFCFAKDDDTLREAAARLALL